MGLYAATLLGLDLPQSDKRLLTFVETDGCLADGVAVATGCTVGHRTMRVVDFGKVAATFVDTHTGEAVRVVPRSDARQLAPLLLPEITDRWLAQRAGYQRLPVAALLQAQPVTLTESLAAILSQPGERVNCATCGEEIMNEREVVLNDRVLCRACAGQAYYAPLEQTSTSNVPERPALVLQPSPTS
jgi:formylmethanofuran dehydrogenase subunit E